MACTVHHRPHQVCLGATRIFLQQFGKPAKALRRNLLAHRQPLSASAAALSRRRPPRVPAGYQRPRLPILHLIGFGSGRGVAPVALGGMLGGGGVVGAWLGTSVSGSAPAVLWACLAASFAGPWGDACSATGLTCGDGLAENLIVRTRRMPRSSANHGKGSYKHRVAMVFQRTQGRRARFRRCWSAYCSPCHRRGAGRPGGRPAAPSRNCYGNRKRWLDAPRWKRYGYRKRQ